MHSFALVEALEVLLILVLARQRPGVLLVVWSGADPQIAVEAGPARPALLPARPAPRELPKLEVATRVEARRRRLAQREHRVGLQLHRRLVRALLATNGHHRVAEIARGVGGQPRLGVHRARALPAVDHEAVAIDAREGPRRLGLRARCELQVDRRAPLGVEQHRTVRARQIGRLEAERAAQRLFERAQRRRRQPERPVRRFVGLGALPRVARTCARGVEQQIPVKRRGLGAAHRADDVDDGRPPLDVEARRGGEVAQRAERRVVAVRAQVLARVALLCAAQVDVTADGVAPHGVAAEQ